MPGLDLDVFVHPSHISKNFLCPITQTVFENPVVTPCEHMFCEDALLEWLSRGNDKCPVCNRNVNAREVKKASRYERRLRANATSWECESITLVIHLLSIVALFSAPRKPSLSFAT